MCVKSIQSAVGCANYTPAWIRPSECSMVLWPFSQTIRNSNQLAVINRKPSQVSRCLCRHGSASRLWSLRYVLVLAGVDALIGGVAAALPASLTDTLYAYQAVPLLCVIGLLFWPSAIGVKPRVSPRADRRWL